MNYNRPIIITLFAILSLCSVLARADEIPVSYKKTTYPALNDAVQKRGLFDDSIQLDTERLKAGSKVTLSKKYPIVPYDPNNPNVKKQSSFNIKANAKTLAGRFARGLNAAALGYAVVDMLGDGIDWVLDPENNSVKYDVPTGTVMWQAVDRQLYISKDQAAQVNCSLRSGCVSVDSFGEPNSAGSMYVYGLTDKGQKIPAWTIRPVEVTEPQSLSLDTIANHVINNDNSTTNITNNYYNAVNDTLVEQINRGDHDPQIKSAFDNLNKQTTNTDTNTKNDTETKPDATTTTLPPEVPEIGRDEDNKPFELPAFCDWATVFCDFIDWVKEEPPEIKKPEVGEIKEEDIEWRQYAERRWLNFGNAQCPQDVNIPVNWMNISQNLVISYVPFCKFATMIKPAVILGAYISALMIISVGRQRE